MKNTKTMDAQNAFIEETKDCFLPSSHHALGYFVGKRKWQLRGQAAIFSKGEDTKQSLNPYDAVLKENTNILQTLFFLDQNGYRHLAFKPDEGEAAFLLRLEKLKDVVLKQGAVPLCLPMTENLDALAKAYETPYPIDLEDWHKRDWPSTESQWEDCFAKLCFDPMAAEVQPEAKSNIEIALKCVDGMVRAAAQNGGEKVFPHAPDWRDLSARINVLVKKGVRDVGFALNDEGFASMSWLSKRIERVEAALENGTEIPTDVYVEKESSSKKIGKIALSALYNVFQPTSQVDFLPRLAKFISAVGSLENREDALVVALHGGSFVVLDLVGKKAFPFCAPGVRPLIVDSVARIIVNNIGWAYDTQTGEQFARTASFIDAPRQCSLEGPTAAQVAPLLLKRSPSRPNKKTKDTEASEAKHC